MGAVRLGLPTGGESDHDDAALAEVAAVAGALLELPPEGDVFGCVGDALLRLCGDSALIFVSSYDRVRDRFRPRAVRATGAILGRLIDALGQNPLAIEGDFPASVRPTMATGQLLEVVGGPTELARAAVPAFLAGAVIGILGLGEAYVIGFANRGRVLGGVTFIMRRPGATPPKAAIEAVVRLGAISLERQDGAAALRLSEERYRLSLEATHDGLWDWDVPSGRTYYSPSYWSMLGYSLGEQPSHVEAWRHALHPSDAHAVIAQAERCVANQCDSFSVEFRMRTKRGDWRWLNGRGKAAARDASGRAVRLVGSNTDITERKAAEEAVARSARRFECWMRASFIGVVVTDQDEHILTWNEALLSLLGYDAVGAERRPSSWPALVAPDDRATERPGDSRRDGPYASGPTELRLLRADGAPVPVLVGGAVMAEDPYEHIRFVVDLRERERMQGLLLQSQRMEAIGTFAGGVAHDFNNLLTAILGTATLIQDESENTAELSADFQELRRLVEQGAGLTRQLLGFARRGKYDPKPLSLSGLAERVGRLWGRTRKDVVIHLPADDGATVVNGDANQLEQVVLNLLVNAGEAMPRGGALTITAETITLDAKVTGPYQLAPGRYVRLSVVDTGVGMTPEVQARAFEPFFTTKDLSHGAGLGLAAVHGIVASHSGFVTVASVRGRGAAFHVHLPRSEARLERVMPAAAPGGERRGGVLLVDDEELLARVTSRLLQRLGYQVLVANDGQAALDLFQARRAEIDIVLLDMIMPGLGGSATFDALRRIDPAVKVLLASGYSLEGEASELLARGCNGFIQKPYFVDALSRKLQEVLSGP